MLGSTDYERHNENKRASEDKRINVKLIAAYQKAFDSYNAACERYEKLLQAYRALLEFKVDESEETDDSVCSLPYTEKIMRQMIEEANKEKAVIADHAKECIQHLRSLRYEM